MFNNQLADLLFPSVTLTPDDIEKIYPIRGLNNEAKVTRIGPSPTGFIHLGNFYNAIIAERLAHQSNGKFFLRIEDTDNKREVQGAVKIIIASLEYFGIYFDEGAVIEGDKGDYGPYRQRQRREIYQVFAKYLVKYGIAYPCFCSESELSDIREKQMSLKQNIGYYGGWASCRTLNFEEIKQRIDFNQSYVIRFKSDINNYANISIIDAIRGELNLPPNMISNEEKLTAKEISEKIKIPKTTIVTAVQRLVERGYVVQIRSEVDKRENKLKLSDKGKMINQEHLEYEDNLLEFLVSKWTEEQQEQLYLLIKNRRK